MFKGLINLQSLTVQNNKLSILGTNAFNIDVYANNPNNLQIIDLSGNQLTSLSINVFSNLKNLQTLNLRDNRLESLNLVMFSGLPNLFNVNLGGNPISITPNNSTFRLIF